MRDLPVGIPVFDAVQHGRRREWRVSGPRGRVTVEMVAAGIDLHPQMTLLGPDRRRVALGAARSQDRSQIGPVELTVEGDYRIVAEGQGDDHRAGGYTILLRQVDGP